MAGGNANCGVNYFCMGAFLIFVGSVLMCALGFTILLPYVATRDWPEVTCEVTNRSYDYKQCMCDQKIYDGDVSCVPRYPCVSVIVRYAIPRYLLDNNTEKGDPRRRDNVLTTVVYQYERDKGDSRRLTQSSPYKTITEDKPPEANTIDKWNDNTVPGKQPDRKHSGANLISTDLDETLTTVDEGENNFGKFDGHTSPHTDPRAQTDGQQTGVNTEPRARTGGRQSGVNVDPRSTLPYSGPAMTSDSNIMTGVVTNSTEKDVIWLTRMLYRGWSDAFYGQCSLHECGVEEWNVKEVARFKDEWGTIGQSFPCFYRPDQPHVVILAKTPVPAMIHAVAWPCVCLISGWLLWLGLCVGCCSLDNGEAEPK